MTIKQHGKAMRTHGPARARPGSRMLTGALLGLMSMGAAQAQGPVWQPLVGVGLTVGGDKFIEGIRYDDGYSEDIAAGQFLQIYTGVRYQAVPNFSVQATAGYHVDNTRRSSNGSARFSRYPFEVLAHFHVSDQVRVGGGVRFVTGAEFISSGLLAVGNRRFDNTTGAVVEAEYLVAPQLGFKLRYVSEQYQAKPPFAETVDGSHVGFMFNWYL